jgi:hypothetical protein
MLKLNLNWTIETILSTLHFLVDWGEYIFSLNTHSHFTHTMNESCRVENLAVQNRSDPDECNESHNLIKLFMELNPKVWNFKRYFPLFQYT